MPQNWEIQDEEDEANFIQTFLSLLEEAAQKDEQGNYKLSPQQAEELARNFFNAE